MQKKSFSWGIVFLMLFLFFPVGIWMMVKKMTNEKYNYIKNGKVLKVYGWIIFFIGIFYLLTETSVMISLIFCCGGLFMIFKGKQFISRGAKFDRYATIINAGNNYSIDNIAAAYPTEYEKACNDLQQMIDSGFFPDSYIDLNRRELITPKTKTAPNNIVPPASPTNQELKKVKCSSCGATNTITVGRSNECEYCGSPL